MASILTRYAPLFSSRGNRFSMIVRSNKSGIVRKQIKETPKICVVPDPVANRGVLYEPPYLFETEVFPNYSALAISMRGYDYVVLEGYFRYVQKLAKALNIKVPEAVPIPARSSRVTILKPRSSQIDVEHNLFLYHRIIKLNAVRATMAPILFECIRANVPEGVELKIDEPDIADDEFRYVPDVELKQLKSELRSMDQEKEEFIKAKDAKRALKQKEKAQAMLLSILSPYSDETISSSDDSSDKNE